MTKAEYAQYLLSEHWLELRGKKLSKSYRCERCGSGHRLQVHHLRYRNIFDVGLEDLQTLCRRCHALVHGIRRRRFSTKRIHSAKASTCSF